MDTSSARRSEGGLSCVATHSLDRLLSNTELGLQTQSQLKRQSGVQMHTAFNLISFVGAAIGRPRAFAEGNVVSSPQPCMKRGAFEDILDYLFRISLQNRRTTYDTSVRTHRGLLAKFFLLGL